ncbi:transcriptional regulator [Paenibacillus rhizosphaerae]|uniref:Transcriptional regulator n=1 Tax=Paenibacillus rhizosphaerae TaxID=297318 RepID=A0A1R1ES28_9BACL|nr:transcriptional regulator [Paenibacillus rhizosphaerae]OMF54663.1 transcriptional regulator [Paenibacillus rhizosphaerae]
MSYGLGKRRSKLGRWFDARGMKQGWLIDNAGVNKNTASALCNDPNYSPTLPTIRKIIKALRRIDPNVNASDFWDV